MYTYKAVYRSNYDGDTIRVDIDLGFGIWHKNQAIRLLGVDTPELRGDEKEKGREVRDEVREKLESAQEIILKTHKDTKGKFGRWLAEVYLDGENLNDTLIAKGYTY